MAAPHASSKGAQMTNACDFCGARFGLVRYSWFGHCFTAFTRKHANQLFSGIRPNALRTIWLPCFSASVPLLHRLVRVDAERLLPDMHGHDIVGQPAPSIHYFGSPLVGVVSALNLERQRKAAAEL